MHLDVMIMENSCRDLKYKQINEGVAMFWTSIFEFIISWFDVHLIGCIKRNRVKKYNGANPDKRHYQIAIQILRNIEVRNNLYMNSFDILVDILAYFLKYKEIVIDFDWSKICLGKVNAQLIDLENHMGAMEKVWKVTSPIDMGLDIVSKHLASAPWLGARQNAYVNLLWFLLESDILIQITICENDDEGKLVHKVKYTINPEKLIFPEVQLQVCVDAIKNDWKRDYIERRDYIFTEDKQEWKDIFSYIEDNIKSDEYITIKIATFHAQELMDLGEITQQLFALFEKYPRLYMQIMVVGKKSSKTAKENADANRFNVVYRNGIAQLYRDMGKYKHRMIVKSVPDDDDIARFRGVVILHENEIVYCSQIIWRFGTDRGVYKKILVTHSDNSLSRSFNNLFTKYYKECKCENRWAIKIMDWVRRSIIKPLLVGAITVLITAILYRIFGLEYSPENYLISIIVIALFYYVPKCYYYIKRKFFIV